MHKTESIEGTKIMYQLNMQINVIPINRHDVASSDMVNVLHKKCSKQHKGNA